jgi:imidazolonepropionase-like amidohydrolase
VGSTRTADAGASVIKIALNRDAGPTLDVAVVRAIADAAHRRDLPVTGHVVGLPELDKALSGGVDELAHMLLSPVLIPQRTLARMAAQDMTIVPTLSIFFGRAQRVAVKNLRRWIDAGGRVVYGTDLGNTGPRPGIERREVRAMAKSGMSPKDIVRSATVVAARCIGLGRAGSIEAGCSADLVALRGDPLTDARAITNVAHVWRRGRRVR